ncbi:MAG: ATP synthase subunit C [Verrucomicrobiia bacterium]
MKKFARSFVLIMIVSGALLAPTLLAAEMAGAVASPGNGAESFRAIGLGAAAAFAVAVSIVGSGYAVGKIGSAALGAAVEKPELLIRSLLFIALAEGLAVLGFAVAMMLIQKM